MQQQFIQHRTHWTHDVAATLLTLIQRRSNVVCPVGRAYIHDVSWSENLNIEF